MRKSLFLLTALTLFISVPVNRAQADTQDEEYKIYSAVLKAKYQADKPKTLVLIKTTSLVTAPSVLDTQDGILQALSPLKEETLRSYNSQITTQIELAGKFSLTARVALTDEKEINHIFNHPKSDGWKAFYKRFPDSGGFIRFSRIGFNSTGDQALVFVSHYCGVRCASGIYYLLSKENGEWKVVNENLVWIS